MAGNDYKSLASQKTFFFLPKVPLALLFPFALWHTTRFFMSIQTVIVLVILYIFVLPKLSIVFRRLFGTSLPLKQSSTQMSKAAVAQLESLIQSNPVFIASKTYCPYCSASKRTLLAIDPDAKVLELDTMEDGDEIQVALSKLTGQRTVPNIFIGGKHIGGNSDLQKLSTSEVKKRINDAKN